MSSVSISTNNLTIGYKPVSARGKEVVVQRNLTFALYSGEMVCMLGPNGCGKSTLIRTIAGLQPALGGDCLVNSRPCGAERREISMVLTERLSMENTTVHDVVALGRYPYTSFLNGLTREDEDIIADALCMVGFSNAHSAVEHEDVAASFFNAHSDGEKQRILIAKALAQQTPVILLDEPTAHLDLPHRILILRLLRRLAHDQGKTILISTHELELALTLSDRILLMTPGQGVQLGTANELRATDAFARAFNMDIFNPLGG